MGVQITTDSTKLTAATQKETAEYLRQALGNVNQNESGKVVFDSANAQEHFHASDAPEVIQVLTDGLPETASFKGTQKPVLPLVLDSLARGMHHFKKMHGKNAPDWVLDSALRLALPIANRNYAEQMIADSSYLASRAVYDDVGSVSGGAMKTSQIIIAMAATFQEHIPFAGAIPMGSGLKGTVALAGYRAVNSVGDYQAGDRLDGINAGNTFHSNLREAEGQKGSNGEYTATIKHAKNDSNGCPIRPDTATVFVNGLIAVNAPVNAERGALINAAGTFNYKGTLHTVSLTSENTAEGKLKAKFTPDLPSNCTVYFEAGIDYEHASMVGKRATVELFATTREVRAHFASGNFNVSSEARLQWQQELNLDPMAFNSLACRNQSATERHKRAVRKMYRIGQANASNHNLNTSSKLNARDLASVVSDLSQVVSAANLEMIARTQFCGIGVIYVGKTGATFLESLPIEFFQRSGQAATVGTFRLGRLFGNYEVYCSPIEELNRGANSAFQMLCIGTSDQVAGNPYLTADVMGAQVLPIAINNDGRSGAFFFQATGDTVNPYPEIAAAASIINVTI